MMICESCKFENREGALFCAECGKPLKNENVEKPVEKDTNKTVILDEVITNSKESVEKADDSEANTTVLTSDMLKPAQPQAPQGFTAGPAGTPLSPQQATPQAPKMVTPQVAPMAPQQTAPQTPKMVTPQVAPMAPQQTAPQQTAPQAPKMVTPQVAPMAPQQAVPQQQAAPQQAAPQQVAPQQQAAPQQQVAPQQTAPQQPAKPVKDDRKADKKAKKADKAKMGTGTKVYIVISIILMLAMVAAIVLGYFYHTDKIDKANAEKETLTADYEAQLSVKDNQLANLYASSTDAQSTLSGLETQLAENELALAEAQATVAGYVAYDPLIQFVEASSGDASTDMMVSDTVIYTTVGSSVELYVYFPSQEGELNYTATNADILDCEWGNEWVNGNVVPITIKAVSAGDSTITITNDQNDIAESVFIHIE